jgi:hypothetical protein
VVLLFDDVAQGCIDKLARPGVDFLVGHVWIGREY